MGAIFQVETYNSVKIKKAMTQITFKLLRIWIL